MGKYMIDLIAIPESLKYEINKKGNWERLTELCHRSGTELRVFDSQSFLSGTKLARPKTSGTGLTLAKTV